VELFCVFLFYYVNITAFKGEKTMLTAEMPNTITVVISNGDSNAREQLKKHLKMMGNYKVVEEAQTDAGKVLSSFERNNTKMLEERISNIFITVGIPAHIKGYTFLREAIKVSIDRPEIINSITKKLYPEIATKYNTSASKVERAIRHAIEVAWNKGKIENINQVFGIKVYGSNDKPTNGEFIALVSDKLLIEGIY